MSPRGGAPLRAWLRLDPELGDDELRLDELGMALLAVSAGDRVVLRAPVALNSANDLDERIGKVKPCRT